MTEENNNSCQLKMGTENNYSCHQCHYVFKLSIAGSSAKDGKTSCPKCGSNLVTILSSWAPLGFESSRVPAEWEYQCQQCQKVFKLPPPSGPSKEKEITCPTCGSKQVHRLTVIDGAPLYCG